MDYVPRFKEARLQVVHLCLRELFDVEDNRASLAIQCNPLWRNWIPTDGARWLV